MHNDLASAGRSTYSIEVWMLSKGNRSTFDSLGKSVSRY